MLSFPDFKYKQVIFHISGGSGDRLSFKADNIVIKNKDEKARGLNAKSIMIEISPAGFQSLQVVLEEELLIMKLLWRLCEQCQLDKPGTALNYNSYLSREKPAQVI